MEIKQNKNMSIPFSRNNKQKKRNERVPRVFLDCKTLLLGEKNALFYNYFTYF